MSRVGTAGGLEHVHGDRSIVVGEDRLVGLNKAHSTHVSRKVVNVLAVLARSNSNIELAKVTEDELRTKVRFLHELVLDPVNADLRGIKRMIEANNGSGLGVKVENQSYVHNDAINVPYDFHKGSNDRHESTLSNLPHSTPH